MRCLAASFLLVLTCLSLLLFSPGAYASSIDTRTLVDLINAYREGHALDPLRRNRQLEESSGRKAREMASLGYFNHTNPTGKRFFVNIQRAGYRYSQIGEILARGCQSESCLFDIWVGSPQHRDIILEPGFQDIGCSECAAGAQDRYFAVCHFGRPDSR
jgi:uncharacterized protein YkwD